MGWTVTLNPDGGTTTARSPDGTKIFHSPATATARPPALGNRIAAPGSGQLSGVTWYRATPSVGTTAWITPGDDIRKTLSRGDDRAILTNDLHLW